MRTRSQGCRREANLRRFSRFLDAVICWTGLQSADLNIVEGAVCGGQKEMSSVLYLHEFWLSMQIYPLCSEIQ